MTGVWQYALELNVLQGRRGLEANAPSKIARRHAAVGIPAPTARQKRQTFSPMTHHVVRNLQV